MKCRDIMTKYLKMCRADASAVDAVKIMEELNCGAVPIVGEDNELKGIVTDRDIAVYTTLHSKSHEKTHLKDFMTTDVITCHPDDDLDDAIEKMRNYKIRRLPVVDDDYKVVGMISLGDIAVASGEEHEVFEALENISFPISGAK